MKNMEVLDGIIIGRVEPHIYAFKTNTIPSYTKIGDTYRPVSVRLKEWKSRFPDLHEEFKAKAMLGDELFFRDFAIHQYLERDLVKQRLLSSDISKEIYYSKEFFKDIQISDITDAISDIKKCYESGDSKYQYYNAETHLPETQTYSSTGLWELRPNQAEVVENFKKAVEAGRKNLLMYAVMRFGKSFTSLCCAKEMDAKVVLVVSGKADVREEWKKTVQSADNFNNYIFISSEDLMRDYQIIKKTLEEEKRVVVFLTLQDLQGEDLKDKHKEIFTNGIDLLIVDETHYGARADKYGQILKNTNHEKDVKDKYLTEDFIEIKEATKQLKALDVKITLHLSGTPYRILMNSEFTKDDIISFCQFSDIVKEQEKWDKENIFSDDKREWDNPYFGFPQMIRFAFNPTSSALEKLEALKKGGVSYAFSALFKPKSIKKVVSNDHKKFVHESEILELFEVIDGSKEDEGTLGFLNYDKIKEGKMCRHIVCVLPYCASCDALEELLRSNTDKFKNLKDYTIINISGIGNPNVYNDVKYVQEKIKQCEDNNQKTLTLTVNRMLTGSTVEQWDTMIFLKDTSSPQEYDQAIFRLQNQYVKNYINEEKDEIKYNMKPQTLLVDFDPYRLFSMQEKKALIYNVNTDAGGNERLKERIDEELRISPIITLNKDKLSQVDASDLLNAISDYSRNKSVLDETLDIPVDLSLLEDDEILKEIEKQAEIGSNFGFQLKAHDGEETDLDVPDATNASGGNEAGGNEAGDTSDNNNSDKKQKLINKFRTYYSRILFFSFLTKDKVSSLYDILECINKDDNSRVSMNLQLKKDILSSFKEKMRVEILNQLDNKIHHINTLANDDSIIPIERALTAINKFPKLSSSEITTPAEVCNEMLKLLPNSCFQNLTSENHAILDIASKSGEFAISICKKCKDLGLNIEDLQNTILSIPTSSVAYEFTRKIYEILGLDINNIAFNFTSYDLLKIKKTTENSADTNEIDYDKISAILSQNKPMSEIKMNDTINNFEAQIQFDAIVGNPPYQIKDGGAQASSKPIYHHFAQTAQALQPNFLSFIMPTRWYAGGKGLDDFRDKMLNDIHIKELHDCLNPDQIFPNTNIRGGVCYFLWDKTYDNSSNLTKIVTHEDNKITDTVNRSLKTEGINIFIRSAKAIDILNKILPDVSVEVMMNHISSRKPFGLDGAFVKTQGFCSTPNGLMSPLNCYGKGWKLGYVNRERISIHVEWIDRWKIFISRANNIGIELNDDNLNTFVGSPETICTESYLVVGANLNLNQQSSENVAKYLKTKFVRFLHSLAKASQDATSKTFKFVPLQDFTDDSDVDWNKTIVEITQQLYDKYELTADQITYIEQKIKSM